MACEREAIPSGIWVDRSDCIICGGEKADEVTYRRVEDGSDVLIHFLTPDAWHFPIPMPRA